MPALVALFTRSCTLIPLMLVLVIPACQSRHSPVYRRITAEWTDRVDFGKVPQGEYNGTMFAEVKVDGPGGEISLMGFEPLFEASEHRLEESASPEDYQKYKVAGELLYGMVGQRSSTAIYILREHGQIRLAEFTKEYGACFFTMLRPDKAVDLVREKGLIVKPGQLVVEERFYDDLRDRFGVIWPENAVRLATIYVDQND